MDTSETYILMRLAAIPDLGLGIPIQNKLFVFSDGIYVDNAGNFYTHADRAPYWCQLERQDQLQAMIGETWKGIWAQLIHLWNCTEKNDEYYGQFNSWEQLWLAFVMKEKYGKVWNGEDWIKEE